MFSLHFHQLQSRSLSHLTYTSTRMSIFPLNPFSFDFTWFIKLRLIEFIRILTPRTIINCSSCQSHQFTSDSSFCKYPVYVYVNAALFNSYRSRGSSFFSIALLLKFSLRLNYGGCNMSKLKGQSGYIKWSCVSLLVHCLFWKFSVSFVLRYYKLFYQGKTIDFVVIDHTCCLASLLSWFFWKLLH